MRYNKLTILFVLFAIVLPLVVFSETPDELKTKIEEKNNQIKKLEEEINLYNKEVENASGQAKTLQSTIKTLDLTQKKIGADINLTDKKISKTNLTIAQTQNEISEIEKSVDQNKKAISKMIQDTKILEDIGVISYFLSSMTIGDVWDDIDAMKEVQNGIKVKSDELRTLKADLDKKESLLTGQKKQLTGLKQDLTGQKEAVESTKKEKATILTITKNKEQAYRNLVKSREEMKAQFEKELYEFESQLNIIIDPSKYARAKQGLFSWPLDSVYITQGFGKTVGAERLYKSGTHNGVDFRASVGTRVKGVFDGIVSGSGNTDVYAGCYSFGKWVMVSHPNGLSTIYAHLSSINVSNGQEIKEGDIIGYSGNTGYSTGPHLHLGVYATQGVRIERFANSIGCKQAILPLADTKAYLDPMLYLPKN